MHLLWVLLLFSLFEVSFYVLIQFRCHLLKMYVLKTSRWVRNIPGPEPHSHKKLTWRQAGGDRVEENHWIARPGVLCWIVPFSFPVGGKKGSQCCGRGPLFLHRGGGALFQVVVNFSATMNILQNCMCIFTLTGFIWIDRNQSRIWSAIEIAFPLKLFKFIVKIQNAQIPYIKKLKIYNF